MSLSHEHYLTLIYLENSRLWQQLIDYFLITRSNQPLQIHSNNLGWESSWPTHSKAHLCKTWLRLTISLLSPGSDELLLLLLDAPPRELWKQFLFTSLLSSNGSPCDVTADRWLWVAWEAASNTGENADVTNTLLTFNITSIIGEKTYQSVNFILYSLMVSMIFWFWVCSFPILHPSPSTPHEAHAAHSSVTVVQLTTHLTSL